MKTNNFISYKYRPQIEDRSDDWVAGLKSAGESSVYTYNELGKQGYEVAGMANGRAIFNRPYGRLKVNEKVNGKEINPEQSQSLDTTYER